MKKLFLIIVFILTGLTAAYAVPAYPGPIKVTQPDGTTLTIYMHGDEFLNWATCGNSLVSKGIDGYWRYASFDADGTSKAQGAIVRSSSSGDGSSVTPPASAVAKAMERRKEMSSPVKVSSTSSSPAISTGEKHFLILLIEFSDKSFTKVKSDFTDMLSGESYTYNGATGSVNRYYQDVSFGKFNPKFDVYGPIKVSGTSAQYAADDVDAVIEACQYAHDYLGVDFSKYCIEDPTLVDNVFFFFPGYNQAEGGGSDCIWPHAVTYSYPFLYLDGVGIYHYGCASEYKGKSGGVMAGIGTFSHEFGHIIGLPDFYDVDYEENGEGLALQHLSLMSSGNYNNEGRTPPYFTYEEKHILGWDDGLTLLSEGNNTLLKTSENKAYYTPTSNEGEYYLYESRPAEGWDRYTGETFAIPGLAIYHIDKSEYVMPSGYTAAQHWAYGYMINAYADHQCMDLVETVAPESSFQYINQCTFPGYPSVTSFTSETSPAAVAWSGEPTGYNITGISFNSVSGTTTFNLDKEKKITGTVVNVSGEAIAGVDIVISYVSAEQVSASMPSSNSGVPCAISFATTPDAAEYKVTSGINGEFEVKVEDAGIYSISASKEGYMPYNNSVTVNAISDVQIIMTTPANGAGVTIRKYGEVSGVVLGFGAGIDCYAGLKYTEEELTDYVGSDITSISFMVWNGGDGTVDKMGVRVYFDDQQQCDCECPVHIFGTMCTVDLSEYRLKIPSNQSVTFVYYVINPSYTHSIVLADYGSSVTNANLYTYNMEYGWYGYSYGNVVISAIVTKGSEVFNLAGFNCIPKASSYEAGDTFELTLQQSSVNPPSSVSWTFDGESASGSVTLTSGVHTIRANVTYSSGRTEVVETKIKVTE